VEKADGLRRFFRLPLRLELECMDSMEILKRGKGGEYLLKKPKKELTWRRTRYTLRLAIHRGQVVVRFVRA
jgi:hypothetical protein